MVDTSSDWGSFGGVDISMDDSIAVVVRWFAGDDCRPGNDRNINTQLSHSLALRMGSYLSQWTILIYFSQSGSTV